MPAGPVTASFALRLATLITIAGPFLGLVAAPFLIWGWGFFAVDLVLLTSLYLLTGFGITVGFHRLFTHRSFETYRVVEFVFAVLGSMAIQGPVLMWAAMHRRHHQHSDTHEDPHSPHHHGEGILGMIKGAWHSHVGWFFHKHPKDIYRYVPDLCKITALRVANALFPLWAALGLILPAVVGGLLTGTWAGAITGLVWGGLIRVFLVHHVTWSVNSACHLWGSQLYPSGDESRDNFIFGLLALGEGWHNTHHAFPTSARHGLRWWQIDVSYWLIRLMALCGLAWDVRVPSPAKPAISGRYAI
ncbi:MAG: acyl-CoA desaturase [Gemmataceae bacterium]